MRCIECEEIELARVLDQPPSQTLPLPRAALAGFPAGRSPADLTRRRLLQFGIAGFASVYAPRLLGWDSVWESVAAEASAPAQSMLVLLYLAGGNDGVNTLVPTASADYSNYVAKRTAIHRGQGPSVPSRVGSLPLAGSAGSLLAFSSVLVSTPGGGDNGDPSYGLDVLWGDGSGGAGSDLAIMPAVDAKKYSLSHFDNSDIWFSGSESGNTTTGWLGRWVDLHGSAANPLQAVSIDTALSKSIRTRVNPVCAIPSISSVGFRMTGSYPSPAGAASEVDVNSLMKPLTGVPAAQDNPYLTRSRGTYGVAVEVAETVGALGNPVTSIAYPTNSTLANKLKLAAHLIGANLGTRIITIHWGGFDTHSGQLASQDPQLREFSRSLAAFRADLQQRNVEGRVTTLVFSEFGRRFAENGSVGTDHGAGGLMLLSGSAVKGGLASQWPGCATDAQLMSGNLRVSTDFRSVYFGVIAEWLGDDDPQALLGGSAIDPLVRGDGLTGLYK